MNVPIARTCEAIRQPQRPSWRHVMGPGLITGASDDDPSGIATYSQAGVQFGYSMGWTLLLTYPLMCAIQLISAEMGRVTGRGLAGNIRRHYPAWLLYPLIGLLVVANTINLGADLGAMAAALRLFVDGPAALYIAGFALLTVLAEVFITYARYASVLKWLTLSLFAYVGVVFVVGVPWFTVAKNLVVPHVSLAGGYLTVIVAVFGTTISPYLFFWQAAEEVEDEKQDPSAKRLLKAPGVTDIQTSSQAAEALRPIAGRFAFTIFALGIVGTGLLAVPVLAGSAAYAVGEGLKWMVGLGHRPGRAPAFYGTIALATLIGASLNFTPLDPIKALFWSAVINGVVAVPIMVMIMLMASRKKVMGQFALRPLLRAFGWLATAVMAVAAIGMFATWGD